MDSGDGLELEQEVSNFLRFQADMEYSPEHQIYHGKLEIIIGSSDKQGVEEDSWKGGVQQSSLEEWPRFGSVTIRGWQRRVDTVKMEVLSYNESDGSEEWSSAVDLRVAKGTHLAFETPTDGVQLRCGNTIRFRWQSVVQSNKLGRSFGHKFIAEE